MIYLNRLNTVLGTFLLLAATNLLLASCKNTSPNNSQQELRTDEVKPVRLPVAIAKVKNVPRKIAIPGVVTALPDHSLKLSPALAGKLVAVYVVPGQYVKRGQIIAKLDDRHIKDQLEQVKATVQVAQANLLQAQNNLIFARDNLDRQQKLFNAEVSAKKDITVAENQVLAADSQLAAAKSQLKSAQASHEQIETEYGFTEVRSPIDGVVANRFLNVGDTTDLNTPIAQIVDLRTVIINATLPADAPEKIQVGQQAKIASIADAGTVFGGTVIAISPVVDTQSNSIRIQISCDNRRNNLREGQTVKVAIITGTDQAALLLPQTALVPNPEKPEKSMVYILSEGKAKRVPVETGVIEDKQVEIIKGLNTGEIVIIEGAYGLPDGTPVEGEYRHID